MYSHRLHELIESIFETSATPDSLQIIMFLFWTWLMALCRVILRRWVSTMTAWQQNASSMAWTRRQWRIASELYHISPEVLGLLATASTIRTILLHNYQKLAALRQSLQSEYLVIVMMVPLQELLTSVSSSKSKLCKQHSRAMTAEQLSSSLATK